MRSTELNGSLQDNILTLLVHNEQYAPLVAMEVKAELFTTKAYRKIAAAAVGYMHTYSKPAGVHIGDLLERELERGEESEYLRHIIKEMENLKVGIQPEYVIDELSSFVEKRVLAMSMDKAYAALENGNLEEAREILYSPNLQPKQDPGIFLHDTEKWLSFFDQDRDSEFSSGIQVLDEHGIVPARGKAKVYMGVGGVGKSWQLINAGKANAIEKRKNVLHITVENGLEETTYRYTQAMLVLTSSEAKTIQTPVFRRDELNRCVEVDFTERNYDALIAENRGRVIKKLKPFQDQGRLLIKWYPSGTLTVSQIRMYLDYLERVENFKPDILIVDYLGEMRIDRKMPLPLGSVLTDLKGLAGIKDIALVTATQSNRQGLRAKIVDGYLTGEDISVRNIADMFVIICKTPQEDAIGLARLLIDKARNRKDKWIAQITQCYDTGQFCLDSMYFDKYVQSAVERHTGRENTDDDE
jgi:replicative DNA helicase